MSKKCKNCGAVMPDEANFCLDCMTAFDNTIDKNALAVKKDSVITNALKRIENIKGKILSLSKKQKAALISALALFLLLIPLSVYMFSPVEQVGNIAADAADNSRGSGKPITRAEAFFDEVFGIGSKNDENKDSAAGSVSGNAGNNNSNSPIKNADNTSVSGSSTSTTAGANNTSAGSNSSGQTNTESDNSDSSDSSAPVLNYDDWEYEIDDGDIILTKYTGSDSNIIIPDQIDGKNVSEIEKYTFKDNSTVKTVTFNDSENYHTLWINSSMFYNCSSLQEVIFPENTDLGIFPTFALNCLSLKNIEINHWQYKFENGALYYYDTKRWSLYEYCEGYTAETYTVPDWVYTISNASDNFEYNKYLKRIYLNDTCWGLLARENYGMEGIYASDSNPNVADYDGVLYTKFDDFVQFSVYTAGKKDKSYTLPQNSHNSFSSVKNTYLETLIVPKTATITESALRRLTNYFPNLKTVKVEKGHPDISMIQSYLNGKVSIVQY